MTMYRGHARVGLAAVLVLLLVAATSAIVPWAPVRAVAAEPDIGPAPGPCPANTPSPYPPRHDYCLRTSDYAELTVTPGEAGNAGKLTMTLTPLLPQCTSDPLNFPCIDYVTWQAGQYPGGAGPSYRIVTQTNTYFQQTTPGRNDYYEPFALQATHPGDLTTNCNGGSPTRPSSVPLCEVTIQWGPQRGQLVPGWVIVHPAIDVKLSEGPHTTTIWIEAAFRLLTEPAANQAPTASFSAKQTGATSFRFDPVSSSDSDGTVVAYDWDFGDGKVAHTTASSPTAEHRYENAGHYAVTLTVTDDDGATSAPYAVDVDTASNELVVNSAADTGDENATVTNDDVCSTGVDLGNAVPECTLRAAIETANLRPGDAPTITFDLPGPPSIALATALPSITRPVQIDGSTKSGGMVELTGGASVATGLDLRGGGSDVRGLVVNGFAVAGISISGPGGNHITGNRIGTDASGMTARPNRLGVLIDGSPNNVVGGDVADDANIISGNEVAVGDDQGGVLVRGAGATGNKIIGNRIGLAADGQLLVNSLGVVIKDAAETTVGGDGASRNYIASTFINVSAFGTRGSRIVGNQIGMDEAGTTAIDTAVLGLAIVGGTDVVVADNVIAGSVVDVELIHTTGADVARNTVGVNAAGNLPAGIDCRAPTSGIRLDGSSDAIVSGNHVGGHTWDIVVAGTVQVGVDDRPEGGCDISFGSPDFVLDRATPTGRDVTITGNIVGLASAPPTGLTPRSGISVYAGAEHISISGNTVAGHTDAEVRIDGGTQHVVSGNTLTTSPSIAAAQVGLRVRKASDVTIETNTIVGHGQAELVLDGGSGHGVRANRIGANEADDGSQIGVLVLGAARQMTIGGDDAADGNVISGNRDAGVRVTAAAVDVTIASNRIGTDPAGNAAWPNGVGVDVQRGATGTRLEHNLVSGNTKAGIELGATATLTGNRVGVRDAGGELGNDVGVHVAGVPATLGTNTVAHNATNGVLIDGSGPVTIRNGPIFENGDHRGIAYRGTGQPLPPASLTAMRTAPDTDGNVRLAIGAFPLGRGPTIVEVYGNRDCDDPEGRVPILSRTVPDNGFLYEVLTLEESAIFATVGAITATATSPDGSTSTFSPCAPVEAFRDGDSDNVFDIEESYGPNRGDGNHDSIPDAEQPNVTSLETVGGFITLVGPPGTTLQNVKDFSTNGTPVPSGALLPYGIFGFDVQGLDPGAMAVVDVLVPAAPDPNLVYVKQLPNPDGTTASLYRIAGLDDTGEGLEHTATGWRLHLRDGGAWDTDRTANGRLRDPGGPAVQGATPFPIGPPGAPPAGGLSVTISRAFAISPAWWHDGALVLSGRFALRDGASVRCGDAVVVSFGRWSATLPGKGFRRIGQQCVWVGRTEARTLVEMAFDLRRGTWSIAAAGPGLDVGNLAGPVDLTLTIGDDTGSTTASLPRPPGHHR
jgi:PKD repeat protein